ncbi:MAG: Ig-like domain-containing protein [Anaerolineales bacterium]
MKKGFFIIMAACVLLGIITSQALAQSTSQLELGLSRDFGYGGFGNDIQGLFSMKINNPPNNLEKVDFFIDTTSIGEDTQAPFSLQFNTDSYALGSHTLNAIGYTSDGQQINSNTIQVQFVPASAGTQAIVKVVVPIIGLVVLMIIVSFALPLILNKGKLSTLPPGAQRNYGMGGGAICPKCGRPFPLRLWFINVGIKKIDRCPYCGKWSLVNRSSMAKLREAEAAEITQAKPTTTIKGETEAEKLNKEIDDSKYQDM